MDQIRSKDIAIFWSRYDSVVTSGDIKWLLSKLSGNSCLMLPFIHHLTHFFIISLSFSLPLSLSLSLSLSFIFSPNTYTFLSVPPLDVYEIPKREKWTHGDYLWAVRSPTVVYERIIRILDSYEAEASLTEQGHFTRFIPSYHYTNLK